MEKMSWLGMYFVKNNNYRQECGRKLSRVTTHNNLNYVPHGSAAALQTTGVVVDLSIY